MSATQPAVESAEILFDKRLNELFDDLDPATPLELYFASRIARFSVLIEKTQDKLLLADPADFGPRSAYRALFNEFTRYQRAFDTAYNELRRLQTIRASQTPAHPKQEEIEKASTLAQTMFLTSRGGIRRKPGVRPATLERQTKDAALAAAARPQAAAA